MALVTRGTALSGLTSSSSWLVVFSSLSLRWVGVGGLEFSVSISLSAFSLVVVVVVVVVLLLLLLLSVILFSVSSESAFSSEFCSSLL